MIKVSRNNVTDNQDAMLASWGSFVADKYLGALQRNGYLEPGMIISIDDLDGESVQVERYHRTRSATAQALLRTTRGAMMALATGRGDHLSYELWTERHPQFGALRIIASGDLRDVEIRKVTASDVIELGRVTFYE